MSHSFTPTKCIARMLLLSAIHKLEEQTEPWSRKSIISSREALQRMHSWICDLSIGSHLAHLVKVGVCFSYAPYFEPCLLFKGNWTLGGGGRRLLARYVRLPGLIAWSKM